MKVFVLGLGKTGTTALLHKVANGLLEYETLNGDEIRALLKGEQIVREEPDDTPPPPKKTPSGKRASVPSGGTKGGLGPEPQPGT